MVQIGFGWASDFFFYYFFVSVVEMAIFYRFREKIKYFFKIKKKNQLSINQSPLLLVFVSLFIIHI